MADNPNEGDLMMKGNFFLGNREFEVRELPGLIPGRGEVRVRVAACGVCGTDVHIYHGSKGSADVTPPRGPGP